MGLSFDADVLIDYVACDPALLALIAVHLGPVVIPLPVLGEVEGLDEAGARALGMAIHESTDDEIDEALGRPRTLSFADYLCFTAARELGLTCVTNDEALATHARAAGVPVVRGFRPLLTLVEADALSQLRSLRAVRAVHTRNSYITRMVVVAFAQELLVIRKTRR